MEIWKLILIVVISALLYCAQGSPSYEKEYWSAEDWKDEPSESSLARRVADLIKRSKTQQFYGLMGRRSGVPVPVRLGRKSAPVFTAPSFCNGYPGTFWDSDFLIMRLGPLQSRSQLTLQIRPRHNGVTVQILHVTLR
ncbi:hypothetical protein SKAU_G00138670 [Synaphobranchus kaupii]|uniref:Uncharacterized protein n=1 Tax=Synaphobranchus kaupii TaxID=118154 RepID=A0A9Q1FRU6_SYNKA|nr:hypothetical protein SKAU_G00138670 [Synaphobranchus kaupii]